MGSNSVDVNHQLQLQAGFAAHLPKLDLRESQEVRPFTFDKLYLTD